jgi:DnaK suppressor protein
MLTEKKLLASRSSDYMSEKQLAFFKNRLETLRQQVMENLASFRDVIAVNEIEPDPLDTACQEEIKQITYMGVKRDTELLHQIEASLDRIHNHEYGFCEETGEPIGLARLLANPNATLSTEALDSIENKQRIEGHIQTQEPNSFKAEG